MDVSLIAGICLTVIVDNSWNCLSDDIIAFEYINSFRSATVKFLEI